MTPTDLDTEVASGPSPTGEPSRAQISEPLRPPHANAAARRLGICLLAVVILAIVTGPPGTNDAPTSGFTGSLQFPRLFWFLGAGAVIFVLVSIWQALRRPDDLGRRAASAPTIVRLSCQRSVRLALYAAIVVIGLVWVSWISPHDTWKGGVCIEIGFAFAAMELVVYLFQSQALRIARLGGYALLALYGVLAWMHNPVSKYLNTIGAVPHSRTLGLLLLWLALGLTRSGGRPLRPRHRSQARRTQA